MTFRKSFAFAEALGVHPLFSAPLYAVAPSKVAGACDTVNLTMKNEGDDCLLIGDVCPPQSVQGQDEGEVGRIDWTGKNT